jgi:hypothetical protein
VVPLPVSVAYSGTSMTAVLPGASCSGLPLAESTYSVVPKLTIGVVAPLGVMPSKLPGNPPAPGSVTLTGVIAI